MSDEHADNTSEQAESTAPIDPALFEDEGCRRVLAALDIGGLYRLLGDAGITQRQIAARTGQSQSEVSEIVAGRREVESHRLLLRIVEGFHIPAELMGLSWWSPDGTYCGEVTASESPKRVSAEMQRRILIAATSTAALGQVLAKLGELAELVLPTTAQPLPSRLSMAHVHAVEAVTKELRGVARQFGGQAHLFGVAARYYSRWLQVPATDVVQARLKAALSELHTEAGWSCYDAGVDGTGFFTRALGLADEAGDGFGIANAAWHAGVTLVRSGHPNDALKEFQLGQLVLAGFQPGKAKPATLRADDPRLPTLTARLNRDPAIAYAQLGDADQAKRCLAKAHGGWAPRDAFERAGMDLVTAGIQLDLRRFDIAEPLAASAVRTYGDGHCRSRTMADLMVAELHVRTGEPRGLVLARQAIEAVSTLQSASVRQQRLVPLTAALEARPGSDAKDLARMARQITTTRM